MEDPAEPLDVNEEERAALARLLPESGTAAIVIRAGQKDLRLPRA